MNLKRRPHTPRPGKKSKKKRTKQALCADKEEEIIQAHPSLVTLMDFFPQDFFTQTQLVTINTFSVDPSGEQDDSNKDENDQSEDEPAKEEATPTIWKLLDDLQLHS